MASRADAEAGWRIYQEGDFALTLEEINSRLAASGYAEIMPRTFRHYGKLQR